MLYDRQGAFTHVILYIGNVHALAQFWNVKVVSRRSSGSISDGSELEPSYIEEEKRDQTPTSLKEKQVQMEQLVYRIWTYVALLRYRPIY